MHQLNKLFSNVIEKNNTEQPNMDDLTKQEKIDLINVKYNFSHGKGKRKKKHKKHKNKRK